MKKIYILLFILVNVIVFSSCASKTKEVHEEEHHEEDNEVVLTASQFKGVGIQFGKVELKNLSSVITVNGMLDVPPQNMVSVSALMGGFIKTTDLLQGMQVKKGQVIATIQNPDFIQIQSQYLENKQKLKFLELEYKRQEELSEENVSAAKIFQQVSSDYNSLKATIGGQEERLKILNIDPASLTQSNIRSVVAIYAPIGGYVTVVNVNIGKYVNPQDVICEIVDTDHLHAELTVFEKDITKLKKGQKIRFVLVNESNKERTASVFLINHKISEDRTIRVHAHLDKEDPTLMPNMYLKALIEIGDNKSNALPDQAIVNSGDKNYIFIKTEKENVFKAVEIQKGISENGYTEVILPENFKVENTEVVTKGAYDLLSKMNNSEEGN
ncbi:MAG TPA: efflux RND transporter periplasmic adaptor subunit [Cytophagaceae bacterium]|jgi:cobalt-zinc-cadmium efflux system membrane fusion protein|nr:efflux RND transporter periplasmic adaptor subunit [Cytophagaceae bacterium]